MSIPAGFLRLCAGTLAAGAAWAGPVSPAYLANLGSSPARVRPWLDGTCTGETPLLFRILERLPEPDRPGAAGAPLVGEAVLQPGQILELALEHEVRQNHVALLQIQPLGPGYRRGWCFRYSAHEPSAGLATTGSLWPAEGTQASRLVFRHPDLRFDRLDFLGEAVLSCRPEAALP